MQVTATTSQDFKQAVSEYIDIMVDHIRQAAIMVDHLRQAAKEENLPTSETDMLKIVEYIIRMKIEGIE